MDVLISLNQGKTFISGAHTITGSACVREDLLVLIVDSCIIVLDGKKTLLLHLLCIRLSSAAVVMTCWLHFVPFFSFLTLDL